MASISSSSLSRALTSKGFQETRRTDHYRYVLMNNGKPTSIKTKISFGRYDLGEPLVNQTAQQLHISKSQLVEFVECTFSEQNLIDELRYKGDLD